MAEPRIDSHHHFWRYTPEEYPWIDDSMKAIRRDFGPADLAREIEAAGIDGVVSVQARESVAETEWLLELAGANDFVRGVVGWVPLMDPKLPAILGPLAENPKLKAVRHVVQGEPDPNFILRDDFNRGVSALRAFNQVYDILIYERQLPQTIQFVDRHPDQVFVLDHIAKPRIKEHIVSPWREDMIELARRANVYCKVSGMVTEADYQGWKAQDLEVYFDTVFEAFGPRRLMFGTDWPVSLVATSYQAWVALVSSRIGELTPTERDRVLGGTAIEAYRL